MSNIDVQDPFFFDVFDIDTLIFVIVCIFFIFVTLILMVKFRNKNRIFPVFILFYFMSIGFCSFLVDFLQWIPFTSFLFIFILFIQTIFFLLGCRNYYQFYKRL